MQEMKLESIAGPLVGQTFVISTAHAVLGRSHSVDVPLDDGSLSRRHCMIVCKDGEAWVQDLGSSNGTLVNGVPVNSMPVALRLGDVLTIGETALLVRSLPSSDGATSEAATPPTPSPAPEATPAPKAETPDPASLQLFPVDTPLPSARAASASGKKAMSAPKALIYVLIAVLCAVVAMGLWTFLMPEKTEPEPEKIVPLVTVRDEPVGLVYDHVRVGENTLYHFALKISQKGVCELRFEELAEQERRFSRTQTLDDDATRRLKQLLADVEALPSTSQAAAEDSFLSERYALSVTRGNTTINKWMVDRPLPELVLLGSTLEDFACAALSVSSLRQSAEDLLAMAKNNLEVGSRLWIQRDVSDGYLFDAITAYQAGLQAVDTLMPKPDFAKELEAGKAQAEAELTSRYEDMKFAVEQAESTQRYADAQALLQKILRMIPNREDARNQAATERLLIIEQRYLKKGGR